jgi:putative FmdB family regulatory protein
MAVDFNGANPGAIGKRPHLSAASDKIQCSGGRQQDMPIYEYLCRKCRRKMSFLVMSAASSRPTCKFCKAEDLEQLFSRFSSPKSEESRLESLSDPASFSGLDENDPGSVARWMKKMGKELGEDFGGEDIDQLAEEASQEATGEGDSGDTDGSGDDL